MVEARLKELGERLNIFDEALLAYGVYARMIGVWVMSIGREVINNERDA